MQSSGNAMGRFEAMSFSFVFQCPFDFDFKINFHFYVYSYCYDASKCERSGPVRV